MVSNTGNNKLFKTSYKGQEVFAYAATPVQAAVAMKEKLGVPFVNPQWVKEVVQKVYKAWYISGSSPEYIFIVAENIHEAWNMFYAAGYTKCIDYCSKKDFEVKDLADISSASNQIIKNGIYGTDSIVSWR